MRKDIAQAGLNQILFARHFSHAVQPVHFLKIDFPCAAAFIKRHADGIGEMRIAGIVPG